MFETLSGMKSLRLLDLSDMSMLKGPLVPKGVAPAKAGLCQLVTRQLLVLNLAEIGLVGSELPDCLFAVGSTLQEIRLGFNQLSGTIPDVFRAGSPLRVLSALAAGLSGPIPPSLGTVKELEVLDLGYNFLNGTIPANMGYSRYLRYCYLMGNSLTGAIPESLALHPALEALDVSRNKLTRLPALWTEGAPAAAVANARLRNVRLSSNTFSGPFPKTLPLMPKLMLLLIEDNKFTGPLPDVAGMFQELRIFNITRNQLSGTVSDKFETCGVFTKPMLNALGVEKLQEYTKATTKAKGSTLRAQAQMFDISANQLSGNVPAFMYANNVPDSVRPYVAIQGNKFTVQCSGKAPPSQLAYMAAEGHLCPQTPPPGALKSLTENTVDAEATSAASNGTAGTLDENGDTHSSGGSGSGGGLPTFATALITVFVVVGVLAVVGWVGLVFYRAKARGEPFRAWMLLPRRNRHFRHFNDMEMVSGMDPLGFGPSSSTLYSHGNAQMNGGGVSHPVRAKRGKGGFL